MHVDNKCTVIKFAYRYSKRPLFSVITSHFFSVWKFFHLSNAKLDPHLLYILSFFQVLGSSPDSSLTDVYTSPMGVKRAASTHSISSIGVCCLLVCCDLGCCLVISSAEKPRVLPQHYFLFYLLHCILNGGKKKS